MQKYVQFTKNIDRPLSTLKNDRLHIVPALNTATSACTQPRRSFAEPMSILNGLINIL